MNDFQLRVIDELSKTDNFSGNIHKNYSYTTTLTYYIIGFFGFILAFIFTQALIGNLKGHQCEVLCGWGILGISILLSFYNLWYQTWDSAKLTQVFIEKKNGFRAVPLKFDYYISTNKEIKDMTVSQFVSWLLKNDQEFIEKFQKFEAAKAKFENWQKSKFNKSIRYIAKISTIVGLLFCFIIGGRYVYLLVI